jgi:hypothetical protein
LDSLRAISLFSGLVLAGCSAAPRSIPAPQTPADPPPAVSFVLGGDRAFTELERAAIDRGAALLRDETRGCLDFQVDWSRPHELKVWRQLIDDAATRVEVARFKSLLYGWYYAGEIHLVVDLCGTERALTHTTMHELLHMAGVQHVDGNPNAIMAPSSDGSHAPLTLSADDRLVLAAATGCSW